MVKIKLRRNKKVGNSNEKVFNIYKKKYVIVAIFFFILSFSGILAKHYGFNKGIDFAGGVVVEATCDKCNISKISKEVEKKLGSSIQTQTTSNGFLLKTTLTNNYEKTISSFKEVLKNNNAKIVSNDYTSPQMTKTFIDDSIFACIFAFACIGLYVIIRFNFKFAISAIIALVYDVLMVVCFISFTHIEVCLITLTAILTIIGYCINDKIVVFDRIKSNLDEKSKDVADIVNDSVKVVLTRSVLTSITTIIVSCSLFFFGDRFIYDLGLIIIFGIIVGTITSLLLATSLLLVFNIKHIERKQLTRDPMWYTS